MKIIDNKNITLRDDLQTVIQSGSKVAIAASCFSIYAFQELKDCLVDIKELRFIFTSPTFTTDKIDKQKREFYIPRLNRERTIYGSEFEIKLRNELTQRAIARECAEWIRQKVCFKSNRTSKQMTGFINVDKTNYAPVGGFTTVELGTEQGDNAYTMIMRNDFPASQDFLTLFEQVWNDSEMLQVVTEEVIDNISNVYKENAPVFLYFVTLYNIFNEFLEDISEDVLPNEATGFKQSVIWNKLYNFQRDAVPSLNTTRGATATCLCFAPRSCTTTGKPITATISTIRLLPTACATTCSFTAISHVTRGEATDVNWPTSTGVTMTWWSLTKATTSAMAVR